MKVTHRGPPPPLPRAARHPPPPRSPGERPLGERRSLLPPSPPVAPFSAGGARSRLPLPLSSAPEPAAPRPLAPARSSPLRSAGHRSPPGPSAKGCRPPPPRHPGTRASRGLGVGAGLGGKQAAREEAPRKLSTLDSLLLIHGQSPTQPTYRQALSSKYGGGSRYRLPRRPHSWPRRGGGRARGAARAGSRFPAAPAGGAAPGWAAGGCLEPGCGCRARWAPGRWAGAGRRDPAGRVRRGTAARGRAAGARSPSAGPQRVVEPGPVPPGSAAGSREGERGRGGRRRASGTPSGPAAAEAPLASLP